jgi:phosphoribosylformimino-5-aminoimidazole carboxamide ribotide isomerase
LIPFIRSYLEEGIKFVICTDIDKDGMLEGPSTGLYQKILEENTAAGKSGIHLIASGGISSMDDLYSLRSIGCEGAILGKAIYENRISLKELETYIAMS